MILLLIGMYLSDKIFFGLKDFRVFAFASNTFHLIELIKLESLINLPINLLSVRR